MRPRARARANEWKLALIEEVAAPRALEFCRARLGDRPDVEYVPSDGSDLPGVAP